MSALEWFDGRDSDSSGSRKMFILLRAAAADLGSASVASPLAPKGCLLNKNMRAAHVGPRKH